MDGGRFAAEGTPMELIREHVTREVVELRYPPGENDNAGRKLEELLSAGELHDTVERVEVLPDRILLYADDGDEAAAEVHRIGISTPSLLVRRSTLEDVFLRLTGRTLVD